MLRLLLCTFTLASCFSTAASFQLSQLSTWQQLLHYDESGRSAINSAEFFLSDSGQHDPQAELAATIAAMSVPAKEGIQHAQCKFPGRYLWLRAEGFLSDVTPVRCEWQEDFMSEQQLESVSLIFATGFLGNPASYYGHLLLRFNTNSPNQHSALQQTALNFGADIPANESMLLYIAKGLVGGYQSSFTQQPFFLHANNYGEAEQRDLWEYELQLSQADLQLLARHSWEVMNADFTYYFFNRNCAFRMAELLELVLPAELSKPKRWWETPQAVMQRLAVTKKNQQPVVKAVKFVPSRQSRLYQRYEQLDAQTADYVHAAVREPALITAGKYQQLTLAQQYAAIDTLLDYYQVIRQPTAAEADPNNIYYNQALTARYTLPAAASASNFHSTDEPGLGRAPSYIALGMAHTAANQTAVRLRLRPAYYDNLDASYGHVPHAALAMADTELTLQSDSIAINRLQLVAIESLRTNLTGLPGDRHHSWFLDVGASQLTAGCVDCLAPKVAAGAGYAKAPLNQSWLLAAFAGAGFHSSNIQASGIYLSGRLQTSWYASSDWQFAAMYERRWFQNATNADVYQLKGRWALNQHMDVRLEYNHWRQSEFVLSMGWYF